MLAKEYGKAKGRLLKLFGLEPDHNPDPHSNGEYAFLRFAARLPETARADTIIDVGANRGEWTAEAMRTFGGSAISRFVCVEPVPTFLAQLRGRYASFPGVEILDVALSNRPERAREIFEISGGGRMYRNYRGTVDDAGRSENPGGKTTVAHEVRVATGDEIFLDRNFKPLLLKIDCDGHDGHILEGFRETLTRHRPLVQFEYCDFWIGAGSRLRQTCALLRGVGYDFYKVFPNRLVRFHYSPLFETFGYQNIVAMPQELESISGKVVSLSP
jgi:FkbM family methyltransferase